MISTTHGLGLALNFSVFYYEIKNDQKKACELAKKVCSNSWFWNDANVLKSEFDF